VFCLNGEVVRWKSSKQDTIADSTMEAEYITASKAANVVVWIRNFVSKLGVVSRASSPIDLYYDNNGTIAQENGPRSHKKANYVLRQYHLICEIISRGDVMVCKMHMDQNVVDPLMKPLHNQSMRHTCGPWVLDICMSDLNVSWRLVSSLCLCTI
jgi:hypothetical protein